MHGCFPFKHNEAGDRPYSGARQDESKQAPKIKTKILARVLNSLKAENHHPNNFQGSNPSRSGLGHEKNFSFDM